MVRNLAYVAVGFCVLLISQAWFVNAGIYDAEGSVQFGSGGCSTEGAPPDDDKDEQEGHDAVYSLT